MDSLIPTYTLGSSVMASFLASGRRRRRSSMSFISIGTAASRSIPFKISRSLYFPSMA